MKTILFILFILFSTLSYGQTVIEMMSPEDAQIILLEVKDKKEADVYIYKTHLNKVAKEEWNLVWKFKKGGFSNFAIFIAQDTSQLFVPASESYHERDDRYLSAAKIYFVENKEDAGYKDPHFEIEGIMRVRKVNKLEIMRN